MIKNINRILIIFLLASVVISSCKKEEYSFGQMVAPSGLTLTTAITGQNTANPNGNGTGMVAITSAASSAITYKIDFGDGNTQMVPSGTINYKYATPGTNDYTITVSAVGTGGVTSVISKKITVFVAFEIPQNILTGLTGTGTKVWMTDKNADGHFGVGPADGFVPSYYAATPNQRANDGAYDDEITFTKDANNNISMTVDNKGQSFSIAAATSFYGFSGGDGPYAINTGGTKKLVFSNATSGSTASNSTQIQFQVPGNGIINFGTGGTVYEIIAISDTQVTLRNIGADGNAWYQKLKVK